MSGDELTFVDTNILVYAYDIDAGEKHVRAETVLERLWTERMGVISTQVLQEFYVTVTAKLTKRLSTERARAIIQRYAAWRVELISPPTIVEASVLQSEAMISFWDALIMCSAARAGAKTVLTEDLRHGQTLQGVLIRNPFMPA